MRTILALFFLVLVSGGVLIALSNSAKPGDFLFSIDLFVENVIMNLSGDERKPELRVTFSQERMRELRDTLEVMKRGNVSVAQTKSNGTEELINVFQHTNNYLKETRQLLVADQNSNNIVTLNILTGEMLELIRDISVLQRLVFNDNFIRQYGKSDEGSRSDICSSDNTAGWQVGLLQCTGKASLGYTFIQTRDPNIAVLIDGLGKLVNSWVFDQRPITYDAELLPNGSVIRAVETETSTTKLGTGIGGATGILERISWDGEVEWRVKIADDNLRLHHDIEVLPNGNILAIAWEYKSPQEALAAGYDPEKITDDGLWPDVLLEIKPIGKDDFEIVWQWHFWDHMVQDRDLNLLNYGDIEEHPEKLDVNFSPIIIPRPRRDFDAANLLDCNNIDYVVPLNQILVSCGKSNEIYIIDRAGSNGIRSRIKISEIQNDMYDGGEFYEVHHANATPTSVETLRIMATGVYVPFSNQGRVSMRYVGFEYHTPLFSDPTENLRTTIKPNIIEAEEGGLRRFSGAVNEDSVLPSFQIILDDVVVVVTKDSNDGGIIQLNNKYEVVWKYRVPISGNGSVLPYDSKEFSPRLSNAMWYPYDYLEIPE